MSASGQKRFSISNLGWGSTCLCESNDFREVLLSINFFDVATSLKSYSSGGEHLCFVGGKRWDKTVCGEENRTVELRHLNSLVWPCGSVVSLEVRVFLEGRVCVGWKHLSVGVDINTCINGCIKKHC